MASSYNGTVSTDGWCTVWLDKTSYMAMTTDNNDTYKTYESGHDGGLGTVYGTLKCNSGKWAMYSGQFNTQNNPGDNSFCVPHGSKAAGKTFKFTLYGGRGAGTTGNAGKTIGSGYSDYTDFKAFRLYSGGAGSGITGGYNGGGSANSTGCGPSTGKGYGGGGATHVATTGGLLSTLSGNKTAVLLVAGGSGGGSEGNKQSGGAGGGGNNSGGAGGGNWGGGGTISGGGAGKDGTESGSFGKGGNSQRYSSDKGKWCGGAGGAGYYGGGGGEWADGDNDYGGGGGGGSGYCNTSKFTCTAGTHTGSIGYVYVNW